MTSYTRMNRLTNSIGINPTDEIHNNALNCDQHKNQHKKNENQNQNELDWANHFLIYMLAREPDRLLLFDWTGKRLLSADWMAWMA